MSQNRKPSGFITWLRRFRTDQKGVAAIEFALIVPVLIGFYLMVNETTNGMRASRKVTIVSRVMADIATQSGDLTTAMQNDIFAAAEPIMNPFAVNRMGMRLTSIRFDATGKGTVDWSLARGSGLSAHPRCMLSTAVGQVIGVTIPTTLQTPNSSLLLAEATIPYKPVVGELITGDITLRDHLYMRPRVSEFVTLNSTVQSVCS